jgi:hypothetical protein
MGYGLQEGAADAIMAQIPATAPIDPAIEGF